MPDTMHCPSCDGYQTVVMDDGQRSVGVCEGVASRTVETAVECGALPEGTVIRDLRQEVYVREGGGLEQTGVAGKWGLNWAVYPATVIAEPVPPTPEEPTQRGGRIIVCTVDMDSNPEAPTIEEADSEEMRRLAAKIIAREKPLLDRLSSHDGPEAPATARECGNDSHHGYGTGYCGDCTKEAADGD